MSPQRHDDRRWMWRALELARRGEGQTRPNPAVGCVIVKDGRAIGEGWHQRAGLPHAEREALDACREDPAGSTAYVTLEPCNHHGRTPPCTEALIAARVERVVVAQEDPNPVAAGGAARLREAGIEVDVGVLRGEAMRVNAGFNTLHKAGRPLVTLKWAVSADGCTSATGGHSKWISGEGSRRRAHALRAAHDAVLVGRLSAELDDAQLTIRAVPPPPGPPVIRVVLDSGLRLAPGHPFITALGSPALVIGSEDAPEANEARLRDAGSDVARVPAGPGGVDLRAALQVLAARGVQSVLVEGGRTVAGQFLAQGLVDRVAAFVAPVLVGAGKEALGALATAEPIASMEQATRLHHASWEVIGEDALLLGWVSRTLFPDEE